EPEPSAAWLPAKELIDGIALRHTVPALDLLGEVGLHRHLRVQMQMAPHVAPAVGQAAAQPELRRCDRASGENDHPRLDPHLRGVAVVGLEAGAHGARPAVPGLYSLGRALRQQDRAGARGSRNVEGQSVVLPVIGAAEGAVTAADTFDAAV